MSIDCKKQQYKTETNATDGTMLDAADLLKVYLETHDEQILNDAAEIILRETSAFLQRRFFRFFTNQYVYTADDLAEYTFMKFYKHLKAGKFTYEGREQTSKFIFTTAKHLTIDFIKKQNPKHKLVLVPLDPKEERTHARNALNERVVEDRVISQENEAERRKDLQEVIQAYNALIKKEFSPYQQQLIKWIAEGKKPREIAAALGTDNLKLIRSQKQYVLKKLRKKLLKMGLHNPDRSGYPPKKNRC